VALGRREAPARLAGLGGDLVYHAVDLGDGAAVAAILAAAGADCVVHSAWEGVGGPLRAGDIQFANIATTCALVDAAITAGVARFVGIGSQAEYGRFDRRIDEGDLPAPTMLYGAAKLAACHLARQRARAGGMAFAWARLFSVYGPGDNPNWLIPSAIADLLAGQRPRLTAGTQAWDYLHIDDVARGILALAVAVPASRSSRAQSRDVGPRVSTSLDTNGFEVEATGIFNLSSGTAVPVREIVGQLRDLAAPGMELAFGEIPFGPDQIMHLEGDNRRLREATGWAPRVALNEGLAETVAAMRAAA